MKRLSGGWRWFDDLGRDLRHALRGLRRSPGFAAAVVLILALGIGAATAMFSIVYGVLLRPLPYPDPGAIVRVGELAGPEGVSDLRLSNRSMPLLQENAESFEQLAAYEATSAALGGAGGASLRGARVSPSLFPLFRAAPRLGRLFREEDARTGAEQAVLLSHRAWTNRFAADPTVVGTTIDLAGEPHLVVGVLGEGFDFPTPDTEFWTPYVVPPFTPPNSEDAAGPGSPVVRVWSLRALGRLRPSVSAEQAAAEAGGILQGRGDALPGGGGQRGVRVVPLLEQMVGEYRPALSILTAVAGLVLLAAVLNAAGLLVARGMARRRTLAVSAALGASRSRLVQQLLAESTVLSLAGGALGLGAAALVLRAAPALAPGEVARLDAVGVDGAVFAFAAGLSLVAGLACGAGPAFQQSRGHLVRALNEGGAQSAGGSGRLRTHGLRAALAALQVALAVVLLVGTGLLLRSFVRLLTFDRGFDPVNVVATVVDNPMEVAPDQMRVQISQVQARHLRLQERLFDELTSRLGPLPDIEAFGLSRNVPFGRIMRSFAPLRPAGTPVPSDPDEMVRTGLQIVGPGYLDAMRFRLRAGRTLTPRDGRESPRVLVANETLARGLFGDGPAVGRRVIVGYGEPWEVVGVVGDVVYGGLDLTAAREAEAFIPPVPGHRDVLRLPFVHRGHGPHQRRPGGRDSVPPRSRDGREPASDDRRNDVDGGAAAERGRLAAPLRVLRRGAGGAHAGLGGGRRLRVVELHRGAARTRDRHPHGPGRRERADSRAGRGAGRGLGGRRGRRRLGRGGCVGPYAGESSLRRRRRRPLDVRAGAVGPGGRRARRLLAPGPAGGARRPREHAALRMSSAMAPAPASRQETGR